MIYMLDFTGLKKKRGCQNLILVMARTFLKYIVGFLYPQDSHLYTEQSIDQKYWEKISPILNRYMFYPPCHCVPKQHSVTSASEVSYYRMISILTRMYSTWEDACSCGTSSCRPGWPRTHRDSSASASQVLGLKVCATTAWWFQYT